MVIVENVKKSIKIVDQKKEKMPLRFPLFLTEMAEKIVEWSTQFIPENQWNRWIILADIGINNGRFSWILSEFLSNEMEKIMEKYNNGYLQLSNRPKFYCISD